MGSCRLILYNQISLMCFPIHFNVDKVLMTTVSPVTIEDARKAYEFFVVCEEDPHGQYVPCWMHESRLDKTMGVTSSCATSQSNISRIELLTSSGKMEANKAVFLVPYSLSGPTFCAPLRLISKVRCFRQLCLCHAESNTYIGATVPFLTLSKSPGCKCPMGLVQDSQLECPEGWNETPLSASPRKMTTGPWKYLDADLDRVRTYTTCSAEVLRVQPSKIFLQPVRQASSPAGGGGAGAADAAKDARIADLERRVVSLERLVLQIMGQGLSPAPSGKRARPEAGV